MNRRLRSTLTSLIGLIVLFAACFGAAAASARTVWLCKPGLAKNPCTPDLATTFFTPTGVKTGSSHPRALRHPKVDCFYVYPTVSGQPTALSNFHVDPVERSIALYQAARYSQLCRVYAPMYRQVTLTELLRTHTETPAQLATGISDVRRAFADYLRHYNHGRPFVLIGHSQGSFVLRTLVAKDVDPKPAVRRRLLSAILMGGDVLVRRGSDVGGDFKHIRACHRATQRGCVIAFSTFDAIPPSNSLFGRSSDPAKEVLCTNPTSLGGGMGTARLIAPLEPFYQRSALAAGIAILGIKYPQASTPWLAEPSAYRATCSSADGAHVLLIIAMNGAVTPHPSPDPSWGLHLIDANVALGNLIGIIGAETRAYLRFRRH